MLALLAVVLAAPSAAANPRRDCGAPKADTLARSRAMLDNGPDVRALTLKGRTLSWLHGDERRSYTFGGG
jgi:hypothetical protein